MTRPPYCQAVVDRVIARASRAKPHLFIDAITYDDPGDDGETIGLWSAAIYNPDDLSHVNIIGFSCFEHAAELAAEYVEDPRAAWNGNL